MRVERGRSPLAPNLNRTKRRSEEDLALELAHLG
jgi:hypothetical protein